MKTISLILLLFSPCFVSSQALRLSGTVRDAASGEPLIGATVQVPAQQRGTRSNEAGWFSLSLAPQDSLTLWVNYLGYQAQALRLPGRRDSQLRIALSTKPLVDSVLITAQAQRPGLSEITLPPSQIERLPALLGEADVLKAFQLLPGVSGGNEGSAQLHVRGGSPDQTLILLDDVPVYYASHLGGFVSVFDVNALSQATMWKGGFPARYGGRLSGILDLRLKAGNLQEPNYEWGVGVLSAKVFWEGPLVKDRTSLVVSARRSLLDLFLRGYLWATGSEDDNGYTLYDYSAKLSHRLSERDQLSLSFYTGGDRLIGNFSLESDSGRLRTTNRNQIRWDNIMANLNWGRQASDRLFVRHTLALSRFRYGTSFREFTRETETREILDNFTGQLDSYIMDLWLKSDWQYEWNAWHSLRFGGSLAARRMIPSSTEIREEEQGQAIQDTLIRPQDFRSQEGSLYAEDHWQFHPRWSLNAGLNLGLYQSEGRVWARPQPRLLLEGRIGKKWQLSATYSRMVQFLHLLSSSGAGLPLDLWVPATRRVAPEVADQVSLGSSWTPKSGLRISLEGYYKRMQGLVEFQEGASYFSQSALGWEGKVATEGQGQAYGLETMLEKSQGRFTGWLAYTLSWNFRQFTQLNQGWPFPYRYDRRHDLSVVLNYRFNEKRTLSVTWNYQTGPAITLATARQDMWFYGVQNQPSQMFFGPQEAHYYPGRNGYRMPAYHRLDFAIRSTKPYKKTQQTWTLGLYNAYSRLNPYFIFFGRNPEGQRALYKFALFPILPVISYERKL
ncbi:MAG: TonB-dependent receptor [Bacteroidota bacterium]